MKENFLRKEQLPKLLDILSDNGNVYYLSEQNAYAKHVKGTSTEKINLDQIRASTPLKSFFFRQVEKIASQENGTEKPTVVVGVKQCDLQAKKILDKMFLEGVEVEPFYKEQFENTVLIGSDCPEPGSNCFCSYIYGKPYASEGFALNLSPVDGGYLIEIGNETGEKLFEQIKDLCETATESQFDEQKKKRDSALKKLDEINKEIDKIKNIDFSKLLEENFRAPQWEQKAKKCVQCTGCNMICPSCYCFFISNGAETKCRHWDACHYTGYARVAGGHNPRAKVHERFRNRYECKLNWRKKNFDMYACTGCGRCFSVAPCKIDIRKTVLSLVK